MLYIIDIFLHLDKHIDVVIQNYGSWTYLILFLIVFCETGLVITPFLPGDSLLFVVGTFAAKGSLGFWQSLLLLSVAAVLGDAVNYLIGYFFGSSIANSRFIKKEYLDKTHKFYEKYGGMTIIFARFVPIIRTFAPFLAGIGEMQYTRFASYNVIGGLLWVSMFVMGGYYFGNMPVVKNNFTLVVLAIIVISVMPGLIEFMRQKSSRFKNKNA